jgi:hypothetical protein
MLLSLSPVRYAIAVMLLVTLLCISIGSAAPSDHPVVTAITGPNNLNAGFNPTGSYVFMASVAGGSPPYTYRWFVVPGTTVFEGKEYATATIPANQLRGIGTTSGYQYGIWLTVTDAAGKKASWQREGGMGSSSEYLYMLEYSDYPKPKWTTITEPKTFPKVPASAVVATTTTPAGCKDTGARFTGLNGQIEVFSECMDGDINDPYAWRFAKREMALYADDHIKTGEDSNVVLGFADMSTFMMKPETHIVLATPPDKDSKVKLLAGNLWTNFKLMIKDGSMEIEMNQAVAGAKGTTFICSSDGKKSTVQMIEGTVEVTGKPDGKKVMISGGQQVTATGTGLGTPAPFDATAAQAEWSAVQSKAASGTPAPTPATTKKSGLESLLVPVALCIAAAGITFRRE